MARTMGWRLAARLIAVTGLLFMACTAGGEAANRIPTVPIAQMTPLATDNEIRLPLDAYALTPSQLAVYDNAVDRFIAVCMKKQGFTLELPALPTEGLRPTHNRRYGLTNLEHAKLYGYQRLPRSEAEATATERRLEIGRQLSAEAAIALNGGAGPVELDKPYPTVGTGCRGEAVGALGAEDLSPNQAFLEQLELDAYDRSKADPRVQAAFEEWSACMTEAGYDYPTPLEANNDDWPRTVAVATPSDPRHSTSQDPLYRTEPLPVGSRELSVATKDVECNRKANVAGIWYAVETAYQRQVIEKHQEELARIEADLTNLFRRLGLQT